MFFSRNFMARSCLCYRSLSIGSTSCPYTGFFGRRSKTKYRCMAVFVVGMRGLGKNVDFTSWRFCCAKLAGYTTYVQEPAAGRISFYLSTLVSGKVLLMPVVSNVRIIDGRTYQGQDFLPTMKDAEHAAAKVALISLLPNGVQEVIIKREILLLPFYKALTWLLQQCL